MKEPLNIIVSVGADGLQVQRVGLSTGEVRSFFDEACSQPADHWTELLLFEKLKPRKRRRFTLRSGGVPIVPKPSPTKVASRAPQIIRRGR